MATAKQSDVTWIKKGDVINGKKVNKGYLALRSDKSKAFSGTVTNVKTGTTNSRNGVATYSGGRNVADVAARKAAKTNTPSAARKSAANATAKTRASKVVGGSSSTPAPTKTKYQTGQGMTVRSTRLPTGVGMRGKAGLNLDQVKRSIMLLQQRKRNIDNAANATKEQKDAALKMAKDIEALKKSIKGLM